MNRTAVFSKTGKGLLEVKNRANKLTRDQYKVLGLVDGKASLVDLIDKARFPEIELRKILTALSDGGYIKEFANTARDLGGGTVPPSTSYVDDLDFTQILGPGKPAKPSVYTSGESERRQREETERKAAEAAAGKAREEAERRAKEDAATKAAAHAAAMKIREEAERRAQMEEERREQLAADMRAKAEAEKKAKEDAERRAKEEVERKARIEAEVRARIEAERKAKEEALRKAREDEERRRKEEEERKRREEAERKWREEEERKRREEEERRRKEEEERKRREEAERKRKEEEERKRREEEERKRKEEEERKRREEEERKRKEEEERKRREEEERKRREEEERRRREEAEERRRKEEEERRRKEEEERRRKEEEERRRKEEEERRRKEEEERLLRELEEKHRSQQEALRQRMEEERRRIESGDFAREEEEAKRREEEERRQREEEERLRREDEEHQRHEQEERRQREDEERKRREEQERKRREEEEERRRREEQQRKRREEHERAARVDFPALSSVETPQPAAGHAVSTSFEAQFESLKSAEQQIEQELQLKEEAIRQQLEEQERRFRMEEEARVAMDRAEREAQEKADREAKELALAAERARKDAEQRSRDEAARRAQEEKEKRARDQEDRRKQADEERKKRERERREAEQRAREEELARRRKEQEEADRRKAELERIQRETRKGRLGPGKITAIALVALIALGLAAVEFAPMSAYAPRIEKLASERLGEPVRISMVHLSVLNGVNLKLDNVTVGVNQDVKIPKLTVYMTFGSLFGDRKEINRLDIESMNVSQDALPRMAAWLKGPEGGSAITVERVTLKAARLDVAKLQLPTFDADLRLGPEGVRLATLDTNDGHLDAELQPSDHGVQVSARGRNFPLPVGPALEFADFNAKGVASGHQMRVTELSYSLYGGQGKGTGVVSWGNGWAMEAEFEFQRMELETAMKAMQADIPSEGTLDAKGRLASQGATPDAIFANARVESTFLVRKGNLGGLDLVRALQSPARDGITGGKTKFDEMSGNFAAAGGRYQFSGVKLQSGALNGNGQLEVSPGQEVSGRAYVELRSSATAIRGNFRILGTVKGMVLKP